MNEAEFESQLVDAAHIFGYRAMGHRPMRTKQGWATGWKYDGTGFPDLHLSHPVGRIIIAELKIPPNDLSPEQETWAQHLKAVSDHSDDHIIYDVWRPADWVKIIGKLQTWAHR